jgi:hypothetical protein
MKFMRMERKVRHTGVSLAHLDILPVPLSDARSAGVGKHETADILKGTNLTVALDGSTDLLRTGGDGELALDVETMCCSFLGNRRGARHVLV